MTALLTGYRQRLRWHLRDYLVAALGCGATAAIAIPLSNHFDLANIVMVFLLAVVLIALKFGRGPAVMAAFLSVALFDFFLVPPRFSLAVDDIQYLLTFAVMLIVALIIGQLTAGLKREADFASERERRTHALYEMARKLAGALQTEQVDAIVRGFLGETLGADSVLVLLDAGNRLNYVPPSNGAGLVPDMQMADSAFTNGICTDLDPVHPVGYFPLKAPARVRGVLAASFASEGSAALSEHRELLETVASLAAIAIERIHYVEVAGRAELQMVSERLRSSILSAVSHDLRTPLTVLVGTADSLVLGRPPLAGSQRESAEAIREQAIRLSGLVANLLDMARLTAGEVRLRKEWQPLEEVIGAAIKSLERPLAAHRLNVRLAAELPLLEFDAVLIERVFCNLLENAAKYAPPGTAIEIAAHVHDDVVEVSVTDGGPGIAAERAVDIFDMFVRGVRESATPGVGLGLAICRAIVEAHGGTIRALNAPQGGACVVFTLPKGQPPAVELETAGSNHE